MNVLFLFFIEVAVLEQRISEFIISDTGSSYADSCGDAGVQECGRSQGKPDIKREWQRKEHDQELFDRIAI